MNERIKQLAEQAGFHSYITTHKDDVAMFEKFAELIVRECMELNSGEMGFPAWQDLTRIYREHFGVEE